MIKQLCTLNWYDCYRDCLTDKYDYVREENFDNGAITIKSFRESPDMKGLFSLRSFSSS